VGQQILYRADESKLDLATVSGSAFDGYGAAFRLAAESLRIRMAGQHDTMVAVATSDLEPLPNQIRPSMASCCRGCRCGFCSPTTPVPARPSWRASTSRTWKTSKDPDYAVKKARIEHLYAIADGEVIPEPGEPEVIFCVDKFGPLNLQPHPGRQWAAVGGKSKEPGPSHGHGCAPPIPAPPGCATVRRL
jgi:hypothetical protein